MSMSYCMAETAAAELSQVVEGLNLDEYSTGEEIAAAARLIKLCHEYIYQHGGDVLVAARNCELVPAGQRATARKIVDELPEL